MLKKLYTFLIIFIFTLTSLGSTEAVKSKSKDSVRVRKQNGDDSSSLICVVGGGLSGMSIADLLEKKGHRVFLFEQQPTVGGKILTYRHGHSIQVEMSPLFYRSSDDTLLRKIDDFELTSIPFNVSDLLTFDPKSGSISTPPSMNEDEMNQMRDAIDRYSDERSQYANQLDNDFGYSQASSDLCKSTEQWLQDKNLEILRPLFKRHFTMQGYGHLDDIPALYTLKYFNAKYLEGVNSGSGSFMTLEDGLDLLALKMAAKLDHIFLNHQVVRISRGSQDNGIDMTSLNLAGHFYMTVNCQKVILAFPPLLPDLERIMDLTREERDVLDHVKINRVTSGAHYIPSLKRSMYVANDNNKAVGNGQVIRLIRQSSGSSKNVYSSYSWIRGDFRSTLTAKEDANIERQLTNTLTKLNKDYLFKGPSTTFFRETTEFFPHVSPSSMKQGFYQQFEDIQGNKGLYYATTLLGFESMDAALKMTQALVDKYF